MDLSHHICPNEMTAPKWNHKIGRNKNSENLNDRQPGDSWLEQAEEQRKKNLKKI